MMIWFNNNLQILFTKLRSLARINNYSITTMPILQTLLKRVTSVTVISLASFCLLYSCATPSHQLDKKSGYAIASWYGSDFHGRPTASGERFNMYALTCAHKSLPFGTKLKISNPTNGKAVVVVVNDRGPFVKGRDFDLSYGAAKAIDLVGVGVGQIHYEYVGQDQLSQTGYHHSNKNYPCTIQVGSFSDRKNATRLKAILTEDYEDVSISTTVNNGITFHRVRIGTFGSKDRASDTLDSLTRAGYTPHIAPLED